MKRLFIVTILFSTFLLFKGPAFSGHGNGGGSLSEGMPTLKDTISSAPRGIHTRPSSSVEDIFDRWYKNIDDLLPPEYEVLGKIYEITTYTPIMDRNQTMEQNMKTYKRLHADQWPKYYKKGKAYEEKWMEVAKLIYERIGAASDNQAIASTDIDMHQLMGPGLFQFGVRVSF